MASNSNTRTSCVRSDLEAEQRQPNMQETLTFAPGLWPGEFEDAFDDCRD